MPGEEHGVLVALEGIDGAGKSTQLAALADHYRRRGLEVTVLREPGDSAAGRELRELTRRGRGDAETEHRLFMEDRREDVEGNILPALAAGHVVLMDRYYVSNMAYQGARGLDPERIRKENEAFAPRPSLVVILDLPVDHALARASGRGERDGFEDWATLNAVRDQYLHIAHDHEWVTVVDADQDEASVTRALKAALDPVVIGTASG